MSNLEDEVRAGIRAILISHTAGIAAPAPRPRVIVAITPSDGCISDTEAAALHALVREVVTATQAPYQTIWSSLNTRMGVPSYRLTPARMYARAVAFLEHWRDSGLPPL
jgi:hypothetical protein